MVQSTILPACGTPEGAGTGQAEVAEELAEVLRPRSLPRRSGKPYWYYLY